MQKRIALCLGRIPKLSEKRRSCEGLDLLASRVKSKVESEVFHGYAVCAQYALRRIDILPGMLFVTRHSDVVDIS